MERVWAAVMFIAAGASIALSQVSDKQEKTKGREADDEQVLL